MPKTKKKAQSKSKRNSKTKKVAKSTPQKVAKKSAAKKKAAKKNVAPKKSTKKSTKPPKAAVNKPKSITKSTTVAILEKLNLYPLEDRLVIELEAGEKVTAGGIIIPDTSAVAGNKRGVVLAAGKGAVSKKGKLRPLDVKPGDRVLFSEYAGTKVHLQGKEVLIIRESDVLGVVE